jgi:hypothetical protein
MPPADTTAVVDPDAPVAKAKSVRTTKGQDPAIVNGASVRTAVGMTEDEKRAAGIDAGSEAGPHDYSAAAQPLQAAAQGSVLDTYAGMPGAQHGNVVGETTPLVVGQAPVASASPMRGSANVGEKVLPDFPNTIHTSPVVRGVTIDPRNDPAHPEHDQADPAHPDYGKAGQFHQGQRTVAPTYADLKAKAATEEAAGEPAAS